MGESMLMASTREGKVTCSRKLNVMWHTHPEEGLRVEVLSGGCFFFLSEAPEKVPRDFFFCFLFFFFKYFLLLCLFDMRLRGLHLEGLQLLSPEAGADVWRRRPSDSCRPWYGTPTSTTATVFYNLKVCVPSYVRVPSYAYKRGTSVHLGLMGVASLRLTRAIFSSVGWVDPPGIIPFFKKKI